jgi:hypothetical protein
MSEERNRIFKKIPSRLEFFGVCQLMFTFGHIVVLPSTGGFLLLNAR